MNTQKVMEYFSDFRKKYSTTYGPVAEFLLNTDADGFNPSFVDLLEAVKAGGKLDQVAGNVEVIGSPYMSREYNAGNESQETARVMTVLLSMAAELSNLDVLATFEEQANRQ